MKNNNTKVVACRGSVTDYRKDLKGVKPRGWPPGSSWDTVPGAYMHDTNEVVIATTGQGTPAGAHVPVAGEGHGSANLTLHESAHAYDLGGGPPLSGTQDFNGARNADLGQLSAYETQAGSAGQQETFAESAARLYSGTDTTTPNLAKYWSSVP
jgi:hypothetical protein